MVRWFLLLALLLPTLRADSALLREALAQFVSDVPGGWSYNLTSERTGDTSVEHFDPTKPDGEKWTLIQRSGRAPSAEEITRYDTYRTTMNSAGSIRAPFAKGDIDVASMKLVREDDARAEFTGAFREDVKDTLLPNLILTLIVQKAPRPFIAQYILTLKEPYSPVFSAKINDLHVTMEFSPATADLPSLPARATSRFRGRVMFLKSLEEDVRVSYSDFKRVAYASPPAAVRTP